jgi:hypothetical protein
MPAPFPRLRTRAWLPAVAVLIVHIVLWKSSSAYEQFPNLDRVTHTLGGVAATWFLLCCMRAPGGGAWFGEHSRRSESFALLAWIGLVVATWEFLEWTLDRIGLTRSQTSLDDTLSDMAFGMLGGIVLILATRRSIDPGLIHPRS